MSELEKIDDYRPYRAAMSPELVRRVKQRQRQEAEAARVKAMEEASARRREHQEALRKAHDEVRAAIQKAKEIAAQKLSSGRMSVKEIIQHVATIRMVKPSDITGPRRIKPFFEARVEAILTVYRMRPDMSSVQIGKAFNRDHTSILHILWKYGGVEKQARGKP